MTRQLAQTEPWVPGFILRALPAAALLLRLGGIGLEWLPSTGTLLASLLFAHGLAWFIPRPGASLPGRLLQWQKSVTTHWFVFSLAGLAALGVAYRTFDINYDLGQTPFNIDEERLASSVLHFLSTGEIDHTTVEHYPGHPRAAATPSTLPKPRVDYRWLRGRTRRHQPLSVGRRADLPQAVVRPDRHHRCRALGRHGQPGLVLYTEHRDIWHWVASRRLGVGRWRVSARRWPFFVVVARVVSARLFVVHGKDTVAVTALGIPLGSLCRAGWKRSDVDASGLAGASMAGGHICDEDVPRRGHHRNSDRNGDAARLDGDR